MTPHSIKLICLSLLFGAFLACASGDKDKGTTTAEPETHFSLQDFYAENGALTAKVNDVFASLSDKQRVGQMIVQAAGRLGKPDKEIDRLIRANALGGVLLLNGSVEGFKSKVQHFDSLATATGLLPLVYSADAEPSLINRKIEGSSPVPKTIELKTEEENSRVARLISQQLKDIGILHNYAPVLDISPDNAAIKNRSYGYSPDSVRKLASVFVNETQKQGVAATVKHFPGHGLVKGDTHANLVFIDGEMKEVVNYTPFIENGVISVMVGHIAVKNNPKYDTDNMPASCSPKIVKDLLRNEMGFQGIIITDAMNMGAVSKIPNADFLALLAGNDIILMPGDEDMLIVQALEKMKADEAFRSQVYESAKRVLRLKVCLGLIK